MLPRLPAFLAALALAACSDPPLPAPVDAAPDATLDAPDAADEGIDAPDAAPDVADAPMRCEVGTTFCGAGCVDVRSDPAHCGRCERACAAGEDCTAGACVVRCQPTETRCEGRCVDARTDRANCGACGRACPAGQVCSMGACTPDCATGLATCAAAADGGGERFCADTQTDRAHCGMCNAACPAGEVCAAGVCRPDCRAGETVCSPTGGGARYCAALMTDGANCGACGNACGAGTSCMAGRCLPVCTAAQTRCGDTCHDLTSDRAHCGACGRACTGEEQCMAGRCRVPCRPGFAECGEVCVALMTDVAHCGGCGVRCRLPHVATPRCAGGRCLVGACEAGWSDCNGEAADGCEVNTGASDPFNCGGCGVACAPPNAEGVCAAGRCVMGPCAPAWRDCDGMAANGCEANTVTDDAHCGACSAVGMSRQCARGQVCAQGTCASACNPGTTNCAGDCVVTARDPRNCGGCGRFCALANIEAQLCVAGACAVGRCAAGFGDCDGAAANGCERALAADVGHCGACGRACRFANAAASCAAGACRMGACDPGFADCDGDPANGCEVSTATDPAHCGGCSVAGAPRACAAGQVCAAGACAAACPAGAARCGDRCADTATDVAHCGGCDRPCRLPGAEVQACAAGACAVVRCAAGAGDCNGAAADGCEQDLTTLDHCGACGRACRFANAAARCDGGACRMGACADGWADCDRDPGNGCEVNLRADPANCGACSAGGAPRGCPSGQLCSAGVCRAACDTGTVACGGLCLDVTADARNCGACNAACNLANAVSSCAARACRVESCRPGYLDCDRVASNGCEVAVSGADRANCGACGRVCTLPNAAGACVMGACVPGACTAGFGDCDGDPSNGCEARLAVDGAHCGMCGRRCAAGQVCAGGACVAACPAGATACAGSCRDLATDVAACGACGSQCPGAPNALARCLGGACGVTCAPLWGNCDGVAENGCERRLTTNTDCGACGRTCALPHASSACSAAGACAVAACDPGWANCDNNAANGCEVDLNTDSARCGACTGRSCPSGQLCQAGACVAACAAGRIRCGNGCVDPATDALHCGSCGAACPARRDARPVCRDRACGVACVEGRGDCNADPDDGCEADLTTLDDCGACGNACGPGQACEAGRCVTPAGYRASAPAGVAYVDACAAPGATRVMFGQADAAVSAAAAPFAFPYWGAAVAAGAPLTVSASGYLRVGSDMAAATSGVLPSLAEPNGVLAPHWGDLSTRSPQVCLAVTGAAPARRFVVAWPDATYFDGAPGAHLSFEVVIAEGTGVVDFVYGAMTGARFQTTGLESADGRSAARPPAAVFRACIDAAGNNCRPASNTAVRFVPSM